MQFIKEENQIKSAQMKFRDSLTKGITGSERNVGFHGGSSGLVDFYQLKSENVWVAFDVYPGSRYWNAFGIGDEPRGITCEINFPLIGVNKRVAGAFAKADKGSIYVLHNGNIGGGREGIGKSLFFQKYNGDIEEICGILYAKIGKLESNTFNHDVANFVKEVQRIKDSR